MSKNTDMGDFHVNSDLSIMCFRSDNYNGPYFCVRQLDTTLLRYDGKRNKSRGGPSEQAIRASIRQAILNMSLKSERANKDEIAFLKATNVLGKRAPSCSLLSAEDTVRLLAAFGRDNIASDLAKAITAFRKAHPMKDGTTRPAVVPQPVPASSRIFFASDSQGGDYDDSSSPSSPTRGSNLSINSLNGNNNQNVKYMSLPMQLPYGSYNNAMAGLHNLSGLGNVPGQLGNPLNLNTMLGNAYFQQQQLNQQQQQQLTLQLLLQQQQQQQQQQHNALKSLDPTLDPTTLLLQAQLLQQQQQQQQQMLGLSLAAFPNLSLPNANANPNAAQQYQPSISKPQTDFDFALAGYTGNTASLANTSASSSLSLANLTHGAQNLQNTGMLSGSNGNGNGASNISASSSLNSILGQHSNNTASISSPSFASNINGSNANATSGALATLQSHATSKSPLGDLQLGRPRGQQGPGLSGNLSTLASMNNAASPTFAKSPLLSSLNLPGTSSIKQKDVETAAAAVMGAMSGTSGQHSLGNSSSENASNSSTNMSGKFASLLAGAATGSASASVPTSSMRSTSPYTGIRPASVASMGAASGGAEPRKSRPDDFYPSDPENVANTSYIMDGNASGSGSSNPRLSNGTNPLDLSSYQQAASSSNFTGLNPSISISMGSSQSQNQSQNQSQSQSQNISNLLANNNLSLSGESFLNQLAQNNNPASLSQYQMLSHSQLNDVNSMNNTNPASGPPSSYSVTSSGTHQDSQSQSDVNLLLQMRQAQEQQQQQQQMRQAQEQQMQQQQNMLMLNLLKQQQQQQQQQQQHLSASDLSTLYGLQQQMQMNTSQQSQSQSQLNSQLQTQTSQAQNGMYNGNGLTLAQQQMILSNAAANSAAYRQGL